MHISSFQCVSQGGWTGCVDFSYPRARGPPSKTQGEEARTARVETSWPPLPSVGALLDASSLFIFLVSPLICLPFPLFHLGYSSSGSHRLKIPLNSNPKPAQLLVLIMRKPIMIPDGYLLNPSSVSGSTLRTSKDYPFQSPKLPVVEP